MPEFIFTMQNVTRVHPPEKRVLEDITLAFFPGAKIGVIGTNGSGKSSLLRIMAGVDKEFIGEAKPYPGTKIGYFAQEPDLGTHKTVKEAVDEAVSDILRCDEWDSAGGFLGRLSSVVNEPTNLSEFHFWPVGVDGDLGAVVVEDGAGAVNDFLVALDLCHDLLLHLRRR